MTWLSEMLYDINKSKRKVFSTSFGMLARDVCGKTKLDFIPNLFESRRAMLMKTPILCLLVVLIIVIPACALFESTSLDGYVDRYNKNMDKAPSVLKALVGNEKVELEIVLNGGGQFKAGLEVNNGMVVRITNGGISDQTILIQTREDVIQAMSQSPDPIAAFQQARNAGNVSITGNNFLSNLKVNTALSNMDLLRLLDGILKGRAKYFIP
jgi:hypothetical protein